MKHVVYADNAATTKLDNNAFRAMTPFLLEEFGNCSQPYSFSRVPKKALIEARECIAACIGAKPNEIFFTSGGTESDNWVIKGIKSGDNKKEAVIVSSIEHHAILHSCDAIARKGAEVRFIRPNSNGQVSPEKLNDMLQSKTDLVSVMYVNNEIGSVQPIKALCSLAHEHGALFHTDAVQAVGHIEIDVKDLDVDFLSASAHKFNGPKGIGFLYIKEGKKLHSFMDGGAQEKRCRAGTENVAAIVGMATALQLNCSNIDKNRNHILELERFFLTQLNASGISYKRNGGAQTLPGLLSLSFKDADGEAILHRLDLMGISISTGSACNGSSTEISHVLKAIQLEDEYAMGTIRISFGKNNTKEDVDAIIKGLKKIIC